MCGLVEGEVMSLNGTIAFCIGRSMGEGGGVCPMWGPV